MSAHNLSPREIEILRAIWSPMRNVEIAAKLGISEKTVESHRAHIHKKLEVSTPIELVRAGLRLGLLEAPKPETESEVGA